MMEEEWRVLPFAPAYRVSSFGRVIGARGRILRLTMNLHGYLVCDIYRKQYKVHRLVCLAFHGEPPSALHHGAHKDSVKTNNAASNLYWATPLENARDLSETGKNKGENSYAALLNEAQVRAIRTLYREGFAVVLIAKRFPQVTYEAISAVVHNRCWRHVV